MDNQEFAEKEIMKSYIASQIGYQLKLLENGIFYEHTGVKSDGFVATHIQDLKKELKKLVYILSKEQDEQFVKEIINVLTENN